MIANTHEMSVRCDFVGGVALAAWLGILVISGHFEQLSE